MIHRINRTILVICSFALLFTACKKNYSSDTSLDPQYSPSIVMGSNNHILYALHPVTGVKNWELSLPSSVFASPLLYRGRLYIGTVNTGGSSFGVNDTLYKINPKTGKIVKKMHIPSPTSPLSIMATPIADGKSIYVAGTNGFLYSIDTATDTGVHVNWAVATDGTPIVSSPVIFGDRIYVATTGGTLYAFDKALGYNTTTGAAEWNNPTTPGRSFRSSPAINDSLLFIGSINDSNVYCFNLRKGTSAVPLTPGTINWTFKTKGAVYSSPAAFAGKCIVGSSDYNVYSIDQTTGLQNWRKTTRTDIVSSPVISSDKKLIYIGGTDHIVYALNILDGTPNWTYPTNGAIRSSPLVYKGVVYIGSYDHSFYALDGATGNLKWVKTIEGDMECSPAVEDYSNQQHNSQVSGYVNGLTN